MMREVEAEYVVVGAGAAGMAFADAVVGHGDGRVALVDRRGGPGGHWRAAYPFVRLHQASTFYGVASAVLGGERQTSGPEAGLHERAGQPTIISYYENVLASLVATGRVELFADCDYLGGRSFVSLTSGERFEVRPGCRIVDAHYLSPEIPAESPLPFGVSEDARVVQVNELMGLDSDPSQYVVVGSGKTATDACVWLLGRGVDPDAICWVRPREPWMLNRARVVPDPATYQGMVADLVQAAAGARSLPGLFLDLEAAGVMHRIDPAVTPTMARAPTLGAWELDLLRSIQHVVRLGRISSVSRGRLDLAEGSVVIADDALVVSCAADGLRIRPRVPIWGPETMTLQPVRAGFPCFGAAITGYVEATRDDDTEKNRLCRPSSYGNSLPDWATMNVVGMGNTATVMAEPDIAAWANTLAINPARIPPGQSPSPALDDTLARLRTHTGPAVARLAELALPPGSSAG